jgi:hypothetical protein
MAPLDKVTHTGGAIQVSIIRTEDMFYKITWYNAHNVISTYIFSLDELFRDLESGLREMGIMELKL